VYNFLLNQIIHSRIPNRIMLYKRMNLNAFRSQNFFSHEPNRKTLNRVTNMSLSSARNNQNGNMMNRRSEFDTFATDPLWSLVDTFFSGDRGTHMANRMSGWTGDIRVDSTETKDAFLISADLPGVRKEDIKVSLNRDRVLSIEAERKDTSEGSDSNVHWKERTFGRIHRSFKLPRVANMDDYNCKFDNGVLDIRVGKREPTSEMTYLNIE